MQDKSGAAAAGYGATLRVHGTTFDAYYYSDDDPLLAIGKESYRTMQEKQPPILAIGATTYVKAAPNLLSYGPIDLAEDGSYPHAANEQIPIAALTRNAALYAHVLQALIQADSAPKRDSAQ